MPVTRIDLDEETYRTFERIAAQLDITVPELLRRLADSLPPTHAQPPASPELLLSFVGLGHSGLGDLAEHHDRYLAGDSTSSS